MAIEAMINGIPVIGSDRGGIPETLGAAGICLSLPDRLTPASRIVPTAEELEPWVQTVVRLWDDLRFTKSKAAWPDRTRCAGIPIGCGRSTPSSSAACDARPVRRATCWYEWGR